MKNFYCKTHHKQIQYVCLASCKSSPFLCEDCVSAHDISHFKDFEDIKTILQKDGISRVKLRADEIESAVFTENQTLLENTLLEIDNIESKLKTEIQNIQITVPKNSSQELLADSFKVLNAELSKASDDWNRVSKLILDCNEEIKDDDLFDFVGSAQSILRIFSEISLASGQRIVTPSKTDDVLASLNKSVQQAERLLTMRVDDIIEDFSETNLMSGLVDQEKMSKNLEFRSSQEKDT